MMVMSTTMVSKLRASLQAAKRIVPSWQMRQPLGRRTYATIQERVAQSNERPWQIAAVGVTVPGVYYLRKNSPERATLGPSSSHVATQVKQSKPVQEMSKMRPQAEAPKASEQVIAAVESADARATESESPKAPGRVAAAAESAGVNNAVPEAPNAAEEVTAVGESANAHNTKSEQSIPDVSADSTSPEVAETLASTASPRANPPPQA
ncbi:hypothetical protein VTK26DRAFT_1088 [Humicola hyalothermophila]